MNYRRYAEQNKVLQECDKWKLSREYNLRDKSGCKRVLNFMWLSLWLYITNTIVNQLSIY